MTNTIDRSAVLVFFSGKALTQAALALDVIAQSVEQGSWVRGASRKCRAALNKNDQTKTKFRSRWYSSSGGYLIPFEHEDPRRDVMWGVLHTLSYGLFDRKGNLDIDVSDLDGERDCGDLVITYRNYVRAFQPVAAAMAKLDSMRPKPVFTTINASPTITATLEALAAKKVEMCPHEWFQYTETDKDGKEVTKWACRLLWPFDVKHGTSRFSCSNDQCESCGHAIRNPFNWVPLLLTDAAEGHRSLWVGRDCAETLFGVKLTGDLETVERPATAQLEAMP